MLTTPSPLISTGEPAGHPSPQLLCDENQIQNADNTISVHVPGGKSFRHSETDFMGSRRDTIAGGGTELEFTKCQLCFTGGFRLESHLKQRTGAIHTLGGQPGRTESSDFAACVINAPTLKEGGSAIRL